MHGEKKNACRVFVGRPEGKIPLGRLRCRWKDNIKMDLGETEWSGVNCTDLAQDRNQWRADNQHVSEQGCHLINQSIDQ
jgi:hypothetical protein